MKYGTAGFIRVRYNEDVERLDYASPVRASWFKRNWLPLLLVAAAVGAVLILLLMVLGHMAFGDIPG